MPRGGICGLPAKPARHREAMKRPGGHQPSGAVLKFTSWLQSQEAVVRVVGDGRCRRRRWAASVSCPGPGWLPWWGRRGIGHNTLDTSFAFCSRCSFPGPVSPGFRGWTKACYDMGYEAGGRHRIGLQGRQRRSRWLGLEWGCWGQRSRQVREFGG